MTKIKCKNCGTEMEIDDLLRGEVESSLREKISNETILKLREKEKVILDLKTKLDEALRRAESGSGSQQLQGTVQEEEIAQILRELYPFDLITPSKRGVNAADILQTINLQDGTIAGRIYYESKRTKSWSNEWITKLKEDNLKVNADICVIVSSALPKEINRFGIIDGVFVIGYSEIKEGSLILRHTLLKVHTISITQTGKKSKMELLYEYLTSNRFKDTFQTIIDGYHSLQKSHQNEKTKILKMWSERERMLDQVLFNSIEFYENIVGIAGTAIPTVPGLESPKIQD